MPFIIKATGRSGNEAWVSVADDRGSHSLGPRPTAQRFDELEAAHSAIAKMPRAFADAGVMFSVEYTE